jgi:hypothetical protein
MGNKTLKVHLSSEGKLLVQLPGFTGTERTIQIRRDEAGETLTRILMALEADRTEIGLDGAPTQAQVRHWERHATWPDERCRFCLAEGRIRPSVARVRRAYTVMKDERNGVEVRRLREGESGKRVQRSRKTLEELDL